MKGSLISTIAPYKDYPVVPEYSFAARTKKVSSTTFNANYKNILYKYLDHPDENRADIYMETPECTVIYDAYPKGRIHLLIIPRRNFFPCEGIDHLKPDDLSRVNEIHNLARYLITSSSMETALHESILPIKPVGTSVGTSVGTFEVGQEK